MPSSSSSCDKPEKGSDSMNKTLGLICPAILILFLTPSAHADQGGFSNSGGSTRVSSGVMINSNVATPAGTLTINCPAIGASSCAGGSLAYVSNDGTMTLSASFTSGTFRESCYGGGRGRPVICSYPFTGYMSGTWTVNGAAQAINGVTYQAFGTGGAAAHGTTAYNSAYTPFYFSNTGQILRSDDLNGTNLISYGTQGSDVGQFYGAYGIALDSAGRIYIADTYNGRVVRTDDMNGTNWTTLTQSPVINSYIYSLQSPLGVAVDAAGKIYILDAEYQPAVIRVDDMTGANWTSLYLGSNSTPNSIAVDSSGMVLVGGGGAQTVDNMAAGPSSFSGPT